MDRIGADIITEEQLPQLDRLQRLLDVQTELIKHGDSAGKRIESLCRQTDLLVQSVRQTGILKLAQFEKQREHLRKSYHHLQLSLIAQKEETKRQLHVVRRGKITIGTYLSNI